MNHDHETKVPFRKIYKMINYSYEMAVKLYFTKQNIDDFNESQKYQSWNPCDKFSQTFGADNNKELYEFPNTPEQNSESRQERWKREHQSDRAPFIKCFNVGKINKQRRDIGDKHQIK